MQANKLLKMNPQVMNQFFIKYLIPYSAGLTFKMASEKIMEVLDKVILSALALNRKLLKFSTTLTVTI